MNVSVFGLGYVGSVTAACLASHGYRVMGVDINPDKVASINQGKSPIIERGLEDLIAETIHNGALKAVEDSGEAIRFADILFICVGTPSDSNGNLNFTYLDRICKEIGEVLKTVQGFKVVVIRSTLLPGILQSRLIPILESESGKSAGKDFGVCVNPEFLREGSAIDDFLNPSFTLIGQQDERSGSLLESLYAGINAPIYRTDTEAACFVKYACNSFHGLKVAYANEIGRICKAIGVDGTEVMEIFCKDTRLNISPRYLKPGFSFGGSCLPKDLRALTYLARHNDLKTPVLEAILPSNEVHTSAAVEMILASQKKKVGVIGLTFKPGTDDLRESPMVQLVEVFSGKGLHVKIFDKNVNISKLVGGNKAFIERVLPHISSLMCNAIDEVLQDSEIIVIAHGLSIEDKEKILHLPSDRVVLDLVRAFQPGDALPFGYSGLCW